PTGVHRSGGVRPRHTRPVATPCQHPAEDRRCCRTRARRTEFGPCCGASGRARGCQRRPCRRPGRDPARAPDRGGVRVPGVDELRADRADRGVAEVLVRANRGIAGTERVRTAPVTVSGADMRYGDRTLWWGLDLDVAPGEFVAV